MNRGIGDWLASRIGQRVLGPFAWAGLLVGGVLAISIAAPVAAVDGQKAVPAATAAADGRSVLLPLPPITVPAPLQPPVLPAVQPVRWVYMVGNTVPDSLLNHASQIDILAPAWFHADANGNITGADAPAVTQFAKAHGIKVVPIVANGQFEASVSHALLIDGNRQTHLLDSLQALVTTYGYDGVNIDFENVSPRDRAGLSALVSNVYARLHPIGRLVTAALPSKTHETFGGFSGAFDYAALAPNLDYALIMAYDQHYAGGPAGPVADVAWVNDVLNFAKQSIPAREILLGVPFYGYNWNVSAGGSGRPVAYSDVVNTVFAHGGQVRMDVGSQSPMFVYDGGNGIHQVWFENSTSLKAKLNLVTQQGLAGWGAWRLGQEDPNFWTLTLTP